MIGLSLAELVCIVMGYSELMRCCFVDEIADAVLEGARQHLCDWGGKGPDFVLAG